MKKLLLLLALAALAPGWPDAPDLADKEVDALLERYPHRLVAGNVVDLAPLYNWWRAMRAYRPHQIYDPVRRQWDTVDEPPRRPLAAWVVVRGAHLEDDQEWGWVLLAEIQSKPGREFTKEKIVLRHPPREDWQRVNTLRQQYNSLANAQPGTQAALERGRLTEELGVFATLPSYVLVTFALDTGEKWEGLPVYDVGGLRR